jgi:hypothetical protein
LSLKFPRLVAPAYYPEVPHWDASELSFGGAGNLWCFTRLLRCGRNVTRKTEDGRTWESRNGRERKNGYPSQILVNRLVLMGKPFDMIELTLDQRTKVLSTQSIYFYLSFKLADDK